MNLQFVRKFFLVSAALALLGRSYQHLFFEGPYRAFFLDEYYMGFWQGLFSDKTWLDFVNSPLTDQGILFYTRTIGVIWLLTAIVFLFFRHFSAKITWSLAILSSLGMLFYGACSYLDKGYQLAQWIEYAAQILMPILAIWVQGISTSKSFWLFMAKLAIAITFIGHGLYAMGYFPVPGNFVYMTHTILGTSDAASKDFLYIAGILDLIVAVAIFIPKVDHYALLYCVFWGFLTALARPITYVLPGHFFWLTVHQTMFEFVVRIPHFMLPLLVYFWVKYESKQIPQ